jgi:Protein of unknown function (DUF1360)
MDASQFWIRFVLAVLATWRITHLLASEDGPADIVARARSWLADSIVGGLIDCFGCLSIWVAIPLAFFVTTSPLELVLTWLALSGAAFLLERMSPEPLVIERIAESTQGDSTDGMLQSETNSPERVSGGESNGPPAR